MIKYKSLSETAKLPHTKNLSYFSLFSPNMNPSLSVAQAVFCHVFAHSPFFNYKTFLITSYLPTSYKFFFFFPCPLGIYNTNQEKISEERKSPTDLWWLRW